MTRIHRRLVAAAAPDAPFALLRAYGYDIALPAVSGLPRFSEAPARFPGFGAAHD